MYDKVTREDGPAMTWAMHTVGFLDLQDQVEAAKVFERSYSVYTREPFKVWSEVIPGVQGAGNFITGAGGFLQSIINGYGGVRLHFDRLSITNFFVPPQSTSLDFSGIAYLNNRFSLRITGEQAEVKFTGVNPFRQIKATLRGSQSFESVNVGLTITFNRSQELVLEPINNPFGICEMKETVVGKEFLRPKPVVEENDWVVGSNQLPDVSDIPVLSNGHIGFVANGDAILLNGLYNGERGESHRARIPNYSNVIVDLSCQTNSCEHRLNMRLGYFETRATSGRNYRVVQQLYAHRYYNRAIINRIVLERLEGNLDLTVNLILQQGEVPSIDLTQVGVTKFDRVAQRDITVRCFETNIVEDTKYQPRKSKVCVAHTDFPQKLSVPSNNRIMEYLHITAVGRTEAEVKKEIQDIFMMETDHAAILNRHISAWDKNWEEFAISVEGNSNLNKIIHASIFHLISNLPSEETNQPKDPFYGLSPSGIGKGGVLYAEYQGHSFWDTEMWMHPPLLLLNPQWSKDILSYRYNVRQAAADNAFNTGYQGYRYPWESGHTGREVTPDCCPEVVEYQHHVISDIAFAFRSHLAATHDVEWFKSIGCDIAWNTAKFWESRVKFNESTSFYDIRSEFWFER
jgi:Glycosyl hydrolase family 65 central catalytic domain